jgi:hypothetical protein
MTQASGPKSLMSADEWRLSRGSDENIANRC